MTHSGHSPWFPSAVFSQQVVAGICVALNVLIVTLAVFLGFLSLVVAFTVASTLYRTDAVQVGLLFGVVALYALLIVVVHSHGMNIALKFRNPVSAYKGHFVRVEVPAWEVFTVLSMLIGLGYALALPSSTSSLTASLQNSLTRGLNQYATDDAWRDVFDNLHQSRGCCGVGNLTDWHQSAWTSRQTPSTSADSTASDAKEDAVEPVSVPPSCCKPASRARCQHELRRTRDRSSCSAETQEALLELVFTEGCFPLVGDALHSSVAVARVALDAVIVLQTVVLILIALLHRAAWHDSPASCYQPLSTDADADAETRRRRRVD